MTNKSFHRVIGVSSIIIFVVVALFLSGFIGLSTGVSGTYFAYSPEEIKSLEAMNSDQEITEAEVNHWLNVAFDLAKENQGKSDATRVYAYLFTAQQDAAALSYAAKKKLSGNLTAVSTQTLCLMLPQQCASIPNAQASDAYSLKVAEIVMSKIKQRFDEETKVIETTPLPTPPSDWDESKTYSAQKSAYEKPWLLDKANQFRLASPLAYGPTEILLQKEELKTILDSVTQEQKEAAYKWVDAPGTILTSGRWIELASDYMTKHHIPLQKSIFIRAVLAMGLADATIAYADSKYTHWKKRPGILFPDLKTNLPTSNQPSYPSGHATLAMAAAIIMDHYFPENQTQWNKTAEEISQSRLWGGVHFPVDDYDGQELGRKIGNWVIEKMNKE